MRKEEEDRIELKRRVIMMIDDLERMLVVEMAFEKDEGRSRNGVSPIATAPPLKTIIVQRFSLSCSDPNIETPIASEKGFA